MAIMLMAWVTGKILSRKELLSGISTTAKPNFYVNQDYCIGCGMCTTMLPDVYEIINNKALVRLSVAHPENKMMILKTVEKCPTKAIIMATEVS
jgi:ferredoxin